MIQSAEKEVLGRLLYFGLLDQLDITNCASVSGILSKGLYIGLCAPYALSALYAPGALYALLALCGC